MGQQAEFQERTVTFQRPVHHFLLLVASDGAMLGLNDDGEPALYDEADDRVIWDRTRDGVEHVATGKNLAMGIDGDTSLLTVGGIEMTFAISHGPEKRPSEYLEHLKREGWVCLTSILSPRVVDRLQHTAGCDGYAHLERRTDIPAVCQDVAVGRAMCEPVSLWLIRHYLQTRDLHLAHPPNCISLVPYDGKSRVQGWHSDIPYGRTNGADRKGPLKAVQRNVCISDFAKTNGATAYKLGSHQEDSGPPLAWNPGREGGDPTARPYSGPDADVLEAPAGSIVLYDARTWHRAGFNHSDHKRGAMLMSFQTADVPPKKDTRPTCGKLHESPVYQELNAREQREITELMMNQPGPLGEEPQRTSKS
ncbi:MAG: phytanoyl-CoA dioxygenase family protein [Proteobacteria bacterium]|nr:phytanoyl-CoA dioxygenase family protein [Pseudomonadota bacterium]